MSEASFIANNLNDIFPGKCGNLTNDETCIKDNLECQNKNQLPSGDLTCSDGQLEAISCNGKIGQGMGH